MKQNFSEQIKDLSDVEIRIESLYQQLMGLSDEILICASKTQPLVSKLTAFSKILNSLPAKEKVIPITVKLAFDVVKETIAYAQNGEQLSGLTKQTGLAADKFQTLANAAEHYGGTAAETSQTMANLRKNLEDLKKGGDGNGLKETLEAFNINPAGITSTDQALEVIAGRMETLKTDTHQSKSLSRYCFSAC